MARQLLMCGLLLYIYTSVTSSNWLIARPPRTQRVLKIYKMLTSEQSIESGSVRIACLRCSAMCVVWPRAYDTSAHTAPPPPPPRERDPGINLPPSYSQSQWKTRCAGRKLRCARQEPDFFLSLFLPFFLAFLSSIRTSFDNSTSAVRQKKKLFKVRHARRIYAKKRM